MTAQPKHTESSSTPLRLWPGYGATTDGQLEHERPRDVCENIRKHARAVFRATGREYRDRGTP